MTKPNFKVAIIDMNNGAPNQGMRNIFEILDHYQQQNEVKFSLEVYDTRKKGEIPNLDHDIYISSGGPGSPHDGEKMKWEKDFFALLDQIDEHNHTKEDKKFVFLICHSFQLGCRKYKLGQVIPRGSNLFGIFPTFLTDAGLNEVVFRGLHNPVYAVDSRKWQVVQPDLALFKQKGASILAIEREREHPELERCIMAIRFSAYMVGTQFHPEADPIGMKIHFYQEEKKAVIVKNNGINAYNEMLEQLNDPNKLALTHHTVLPNFLSQAINYDHTL
ncbi:glutamine amidotransferase-related protein [Pedobacter montanisoli]|uniref:GMP synthase n=1 Tax=Pedobacter montanisoli TaxID=2923277 RepID=A0ABS9ZTP1_9SPHI|nr:GMP synthase [Pedobacter montanisoli]MCJ0741950.1 GMP synthase [Pedobacter montanisoli]